MAYEFHNRVKLDGFDFPDTQFTVNLATGINSTHIGLAMTQDTTAPNQMKLAGNGDEVVAILLQVEDRTNVEAQVIGTVSFKFADLMPIASGLSGAAVVAVGSKVIGAGNGTIKAADPANAPAFGLGNARVWEIRGTNAVVVKP